MKEHINPSDYINQIYKKRSNPTEAYTLYQELIKALLGSFPLPLAYQQYASLPLSQEDHQRLDYELSIITFYLNRKEEGLIALNHLSLTQGPLRDRFIDNAFFYITPIPVLCYYPLKVPSSETFYPYNPSIVPYQDGYIINIRHGDAPPDENGIFLKRRFTSKNYLAIYNASLELQKYFLLLPPPHLDPRPSSLPSSISPLPSLPITPWSSPISDCVPPWILHVEDIRLKWENADTLYFTAVCLNNHPYGNISRISFGHISLGGDTSGFLNALPRIENIVPLASPHKYTGCEKNWLYLGKGRFLYDPFTIIEGTKVLYRTTKIGNLRCGGGPVEYGNGMLIITHEVYPSGRGIGRIYIHRFVYWERKRNEEAKGLEQMPDLGYGWGGGTVKVSYPFYFRIRGVEYVPSLCWSQEEGNKRNKILVGLGIGDKEAWVAAIAKDEVDKIIENGVEGHIEEL